MHSPTSHLATIGQAMPEEPKVNCSVGWLSAFRLVGRSASFPLSGQSKLVITSLDNDRRDTLTPFNGHLPLLNVGHSGAAGPSATRDHHRGSSLTTLRSPQRQEAADSSELVRFSGVHHSVLPPPAAPSSLELYTRIGSSSSSEMDSTSTGDLAAPRRLSMSCSEESFEGNAVLCQVCGDRASGFHYGVHACEGCKGFFRRSIQQKIQYRPCTKNQRCSVLRINRNRCQYCRLKKCIAVGMSRDAVRFGRVPKREKAKMLAEMQRANVHSQTANLTMLLEDDQQVMAGVVSAFLEAKFYFKSRSLPLVTLFHEKRYLLRPSGTACPLHFDSSMLADLNNDESASSYLPALRAIVNFAKNIPGFLILPSEDQVVLIKAAMFELLLLHLSSLFDSGTKSVLLLNGSVYRRGSCMSSQRNAVAPGANRFLIDSLFDFVDHFNVLQVTDVEMALFSAIVLVSSSRPGLKNPELVNRLSDRLKQLLQEIVRLQHGGEMRLFEMMMMKIPDLRTLNTLHAENLLISNFNANERRGRTDLCPKKGKIGSSNASFAIKPEQRSRVYMDNISVTVNDNLLHSLRLAQEMQDVACASTEATSSADECLVDLSMKSASASLPPKSEKAPLEALNLKVVNSSYSSSSLSGVQVKAELHSPGWLSKDNTSFDSGKGSLSATESCSSNDSLNEHHLDEYDHSKSVGAASLGAHKPLGLSASLDQARLHLREKMPTLKQALQTPPLFSLPKVARTSSYNVDDRDAANSALREKHVCLASLLERRPDGEMTVEKRTPPTSCPLNALSNSSLPLVDRATPSRKRLPCTSTSATTTPQWSNVFNVPRSCVGFDGADVMQSLGGVGRSALIRAHYLPFLNDSLLNARLLNSTFAPYVDEEGAGASNFSSPTTSNVAIDLSRRMGVINAVGVNQQLLFLRANLSTDAANRFKTNGCPWVGGAVGNEMISPKREFPLEACNEEPLNLSKKATTTTTTTTTTRYESDVADMANSCSSSSSSTTTQTAARQCVTIKSEPESCFPSP